MSEKSNRTYKNENADGTKLTIKDTKSRVRIPSSSISLSIAKIILLVLICVALVRATLGGSYVSLTSFLDFMSKAPDIPLNWIGIFQTGIVGDWGAFNFFKGFLNSISQIIGAGLYLSTGIAQLVVFISYFIGFIFMI